MKIRHTFIVAVGLLCAPMVLPADKWPDSSSAVPAFVRADIDRYIEDHVLYADLSAEPDGARIQSDGYSTYVYFGYDLDGSGLEDGFRLVVYCTYQGTKRKRCMQSTLYDGRIESADLKAAGDVPTQHAIVNRKAKSNNSLEGDGEAAPQLDR